MRVGLHSCPRRLVLDSLRSVQPRAPAASSLERNRRPLSSRGIMTRLPARGAFIVFEGVDRSGKTTQSRLLLDHLEREGIPAELWRFPDRTTPIGQMIDAYLKRDVEADDAAVHLLFAANRWEKRAELLRKLGQGVTIVADRYAFSGVAFTAAKGVPGLDAAWCRASDAGLPAPDAVFYLDVSPEVAAARGGYGEERYETKQLQAAVRSEFQRMVGPTWTVIDAGAGIDAIQAELKERASVLVERAAAGLPVDTLWKTGEA